MAIQSDAFGRVTLTDSDARKFENQVTYGKPKKQAVDAAKRAKKLVRKFSKNRTLSGKVTVSGGS